jgi:hypothetical protein
VTDRTSDGSVSAAVIDSAIGASSLPLHRPEVSSACRRPGATVTARLALVVACTPPLSVAMAVTVSVKSASLLAGGVMVESASCAGRQAPHAATEVGAVVERRTGRNAADGDASVSEPSVSVRRRRSTARSARLRCRSPAPPQVGCIGGRGDRDRDRAALRGGAAAVARGGGHRRA